MPSATPTAVNTPYFGARRTETLLAGECVTRGASSSLRASSMAQFTHPDAERDRGICSPPHGNQRGDVGARSGRGDPPSVHCLRPCEVTRRERDPGGRIHLDDV